MTDRLTPEREAEIAARADAASPAPWFLHEDWPGRVFSESQFNHHIARVTGTNPEPNERFIAHARTDVPALLAELAAVRAERDQARAALREAADQIAELQENLRAVNAGWSVARARVAELEQAAEKIRHLHTDSPMGPCPVCIDADAMVRGDDYTLPYPCPTARLAGAKDCDPPSFRATPTQTAAEA